MERKKIKIGLFGFGVVGKGLYDVLNANPGLRAEIVKICVKNQHKERPIPKEHFTFYKHELLYNDDVNVIVELIDDADAAFEIVKTALQNGKAVVSANKKMIAEHLTELLELQKTHNAPLLYEAACCASIPVVRNLEEYYDNDLLQSLCGIINGSTNYILTKMSEDKISFHDALAQAQQLGYAESNPALDVEGFDAKNKLTILLAHAFGIIVKPEEVFHGGIQKVGELESRYAKEKGYKMKLVARAQKLGDGVAAFVLPQFVKNDSRLFHVDDVFNGVEIEGCFADKQFFNGRGAGAFPTASAVLSDISALSYDYHYEYKKLHQDARLQLTENFSLEVFIRFPQDKSFVADEFDVVHEHYRSGGWEFVTGRIHFSKIARGEWAYDEDVSVVVCGEPSLQHEVLVDEMLEESQ
ncbi:MAG: homoserine dehydrogenase [Flavobacteriales bacterium]|nr:homoserine dehydrogenase [Flavobacteriales bacterium]